MADMDSGGSRNRQSPTSVRRNAPPKRVVPKQPRSKVRVGGGTTNNNNRKKTSNNDRDNYRSNAVERRATGNRRSSGRVKETTPKAVPPVAKTIIPPAPPKPAPPKASDYLRTDSTYQRQAAAYQKSLADFMADQGLASADYNSGYQQTFRDIGLAKGDAQQSLKDDYASRGMLQSSLYNEGLGELNTQYQNQFNDLTKQRTSFLDQLAQEQAKYKNEQGTQLTNAQQEALRRRAEKYGL
jgi:hypothetical protein